MRRLGAQLALWFALPACNQLLGISNPVAGDATQSDGPRPDGDMGPADAALDAPPACTTSTAFGGDITSPIGGTGVALALGRFDAGATTDVAIAITTDTVIMAGDNAGHFTVAQLLTQPAIGIVADDFDIIGTRNDLFILTGTDAVVRQQSEANGGAGTFLAAQTVDTFTNAETVLLGEVGGTLVSDVVVQDGTGSIAYTSAATAGTFTQEDTIGAAGDKLVFVGQIDRQNDHDVVFVDAAGNVKLALSDGSDGSFGAPTTIATGATGRGVGVGKFDDDNFVDIVVATANGGEIYLQSSASPGVFTKQTGTFGGIESTVPLLVGDVNGDGLDDVVTPTTVTLQCPTTHAFTQVESIDAANGVLADINGNGKPDLLRLSGTDLIVRLQ